MPSIIIDPEEKKTNPLIGIFSHLGLIYILILGICFGIVYFQGVYQGNYLSIYIPFTHIWPLALIAVGLSLFQVKSSASLSVGIFLMVLAITITMYSVFIRADAIDSTTETISASSNGVKSIYTDISATSTDISVRGGVADMNAQYISNYGILTNSIEVDKDSVQNITLEQLDIQPGFGSYNKNISLSLPNTIPTIFNMTANISSLNLDLQGIVLKSANITLRGSNASIILDKVEAISSLNITSTASQVTITIPQNIKVLLSTSHTFTTNNFIGLSQTEEDSQVYKSSKCQYSS